MFVINNNKKTAYPDAPNVGTNKIKVPNGSNLRGVDMQIQETNDRRRGAAGGTGPPRRH